MVRTKSNFPREGEFIVGKVFEIQDQHVMVDLVDYRGLGTNPDECAVGMIHITEISTRWVRNIRSHVKAGQRVVLRVLRVDTVKGHVDLSLRRVNSAQKDIRLKEWKYAVKYENLLQFLADQTGQTLDQVYDSVGFPILDKFNNYQETIEDLKESGEEILKSLKKVPDDIKKKFLTIIEENVKISTVNIVGKIKLSFLSDNGIEYIRNALIKAKNVISNPKETRNLRINYIGAPFYRLEIVSKEYLDAENVLSEVLDLLEKDTQKYNGIFEFIRE